MERVAVVGSREGADLEHVTEFLAWLGTEHPDSILVSGGARGVDTWAEKAWLTAPGVVFSYRPKQLGPEEYGIELWELGCEQPRVYVLANEPTWADYGSACLYRDMLIADNCDRLVAFYRFGKSSGAAATAEWARHYGKQVYEYESERVAS